MALDDQLIYLFHELRHSELKAPGNLALSLIEFDFDAVATVPSALPIIPELMPTHEERSIAERHLNDHIAFIRKG